MNKIFDGFSTDSSSLRGRVLGSILLLCGSSIGVGILPLPILTGMAGPMPTTVFFVVCAVYMTITALLILESSLLLKDASFISIAKRFLGRIGQILVLASFLFLFYSLTTAYLSKGGELTHKLLQKALLPSMPEWTGALVLAILSAALIFYGTVIVDYLNRIFLFGFFITYLFLSTSGLQYASIENLNHTNWNYSLLIIPFIITSFGYHNLVPVVGSYLNRDRKSSIKAFLMAGAALLLVYVIWVVVLQSILPLNGPVSISESLANGEIVTQPLAKFIGSPFIQYGAAYMAFFAIITSILGQGLSIIEFLSEWTGLKKTIINRVILCGMLFVPTFFCSQLIPGVFFKALEFAGGVAAMVIFGIIPSMLGWIQRYKRKDSGFQEIVPGGKPMLVLVFCFAAFVISYELVKIVIS